MGVGPVALDGGKPMVTMHVTLRQTMGEWELVAVVTESYGAGLEPVSVRGVWQSPLTATEWDSDPLGAALNALRRWSDLTMADHARQP